MALHGHPWTSGGHLRGRPPPAQQVAELGVKLVVAGWFGQQAVELVGPAGQWSTMLRMLPYLAVVYDIWRRDSSDSWLMWRFRWVRTLDLSN